MEPVKLWAVPRIWRDETCYILGGGPSLRLLNIDALEGKRVIAVNNAFLLARWIDVLYFGDIGWWRQHNIALREFSGLVVTRRAELASKQFIKVVKHENRPFGISTSPSLILWNKSSGAAAINLAVLLGAKKIILLGFDMRIWSEEDLKRLAEFGNISTPSIHNWHSDHKHSNNSKGSHGDRYERFLEPFEHIAADLKRLGIECLNATPRSALKVFPFADPQKLISEQDTKRDQHFVSMTPRLPKPTKNSAAAVASRWLSQDYALKREEIWKVPPMPALPRHRKGKSDDVPRLWNGAECYILGGGPSLQNFDMELLSGKHVIAVNNAYQLAPEADVLFWGDCMWHEKHFEALNGFTGLQITVCQRDIEVPESVKFIKCKYNAYGFSSSRRYLVWNLNAGACAVNLARWLGAKRIFLLGFDMRQIGGSNNWHNDHFTSNKPEFDPYSVYLFAWPHIAMHAKVAKVEIFNATPGSAIKCFPFVELGAR